MYILRLICELVVQIVVKLYCDFRVDRIASFSRGFLEFRFQYRHALGNFVDLGAATRERRFRGLSLEKDAGLETAARTRILV